MELYIHSAITRTLNAPSQVLILFLGSCPFLTAAMQRLKRSFLSVFSQGNQSPLPNLPLLSYPEARSPKVFSSTRFFFSASQMNSLPLFAESYDGNPFLLDPLLLSLQKLIRAFDWRSPAWCLKTFSLSPTHSSTGGFSLPENLFSFPARYRQESHVGFLKS